MVAQTKPLANAGDKKRLSPPPSQHLANCPFKRLKKALGNEG